MVLVRRSPRIRRNRAELEFQYSDVIGVECPPAADVRLCPMTSSPRHRITASTLHTEFDMATPSPVGWHHERAAVGSRDRLVSSRLVDDHAEASRRVADISAGELRSSGPDGCPEGERRRSRVDGRAARGFQGARTPGHYHRGGGNEGRTTEKRQRVRIPAASA